MILLVTLTVSFCICFSKCSSLEGYHYKSYLYMLFVLSVVLIILGAIISAKSKQCLKTGHPDVIWALGLFIFIICAVYFYLEYKQTGIALF